MKKFKSVSEGLPEYTDFVWIKCEGSDKINLAYFSQFMDQPQFQYAETVGDREGLSVEYYANVTHWAKLESPEFDDSEMEQGKPVLRNDGAFLVVVDLADGEQTTTYFTLQELEIYLRDRAGDLAMASAKRALAAVQSIGKDLKPKANR